MTLRGGVLLVTLALLGAAEPAPVQQVPPEAAMAILGHKVDGPDGKEIARIIDVLVNDNGEPVAAVIDFGGFLGVGIRTVAVDWKTLKFTPADKAHPVVLEMSMDKIRAAPAYKEEKVAPVVTPAAAPAAPVAPPAAPAAPVAPPAAPAPIQVPAAPSSPAAPVAPPAAPAPIQVPAAPSSPAAPTPTVVAPVAPVVPAPPSPSPTRPSPTRPAPAPDAAPAPAGQQGTAPGKSP